jgi:hypothetical protein
VDSRRIESALLSLREFKGLYGGKEQALVFLDVINEAKLPKDLLGFFTLDNASSNDKMLCHITQEIDGFDLILQQIRYFSHIINLVIQAFLFGAKNRTGEDLDS